MPISPGPSVCSAPERPLDEGTPSGHKSTSRQIDPNSSISSSFTYLKPLDREALRKILVEPKNSIVKQFTKLFEMDGIKLTFTDGALDYIVDKAVEYKLGARGLRSIVESVVNEAMFELPSKDVKELEVTRDYAAQELEKSTSLRRLEQGK